MLDQHHRGAEFIVHIQNEAAHVLLFFHVHASHRFVQQQHLGLQRQGAAQVDTLLQAIGQLPDRRFAVGLDFQKVDDFFHPLAVFNFFAFCRTPAQGLHEQIAFHAQVAPGHDVVQHAHAFEQGQVLEGAGHAHDRHLVAVHVAESLAAKRDAALLRCVDAVDAIEHRAFARAIGADDGADFMLAHIKADV